MESIQNFVFPMALLVSRITFGVSHRLNPQKIAGDECGVTASQHLLHQDPWMVYLEYWRNNSETSIRCGATLVDQWHLLTAAHCVRNVKFTRIVARLGEYRLSTRRDCILGICNRPPLRINVEQLIVHPDYDGIENDIAILRLNKPAPYTDFIRPICLPTKHFAQDAIFASAGWGEEISSGLYSNVKKSIRLPHWDTARCQKAYSRTQLPKRIICAGGQEGVDTCRGDSGGPLSLTRGSTELWGVVSLGNTHCGLKDHPGIYTSVADYLDWIIKTIG